MDSSNLAICIGPNMLSPGTESALPLEVQKEMNDKVTVLVEFLINNCLEIFEEDIAFPACALAEESPEHTDSSTGETKLEGFDAGFRNLWCETSSQ
ncbi:T-cell activation Rho GTPase-activating protein-like [Passer montanus]|uniref:T-cell activation Rho GTPase-activating protein-like n=1 Tax=Passer montanus TaxID=9160 RepID=UPI001960AD2D|nr:T-cell activation Rho GTPase-activating protein-like [Passer montanus]